MKTGCQRIAAALALATLLVACDGPRLARGADALRYRQIFVPEEDLESQIRGLLPMKRADYESRIKQLSESGKDHPPVPLARLERAVYRGRLEGDALAGTAAL